MKNLMAKNSAIFTQILILFLVLMIVGCSATIPTSDRTTTKYRADGTVESVTQEEDVAPTAISDADARVVEACFDYFQTRTTERNKNYATMESNDRAWAMTFDRYSDTILALQGYTPEAVCSTPENIYSYAVKHDKAMFQFYATAVREGRLLAGDVAPWVAVTKMINRVGNTYGDGSQHIEGNDNKIQTGDIEKTTKVNVAKDATITQEDTDNSVKGEVAEEEEEEVEEGAVTTEE